MADTAVSAVESALENQRIGSLQLRVALLCTLVQICDGYDINSVAWAVPKLIDVGICRRPPSPRLFSGRASASWSALCRPGRSAIAMAASRSWSQAC
jgi:hypothetical protein